MNLASLKSQLNQLYAKLSGREKGLIGAAILVIALIVFYLTVGKVYAVFLEQKLAMADIESDVTGLKYRLESYINLKQRREGIEDQYKAITFPEGERTYLVNLIKSKVGADPQSLEKRDEEKFGGNYMQLPFGIKFNTTNLPGLIDFLKELVEGAKPFIISRLELNRRKGFDFVEVDLVASTIRRVEK